MHSDYQRFTDRARKVFQLAHQEALRFRHEYIGTEHILLGLIREGSGVAAAVLTQNLGVDLKKAQRETERLLKPGPTAVKQKQIPQTPRAKRAIEAAMEEARSLHHEYVGSEHILLGLLRDQESVAAQVLMNLGVRLDSARQEVMKLLGLPQNPMQPSTENVWLPPEPKFQEPAERSYRLQFDEPLAGSPRVSKLLLLMLFLSLIVNAILAALLWQAYGG